MSARIDVEALNVVSGIESIAVKNIVRVAICFDESQSLNVLEPMQAQGFRLVKTGLKEIGDRVWDVEKSVYVFEKEVD